MTHGPELTDTAELIELDSYKKANKYLNLGWVLISTHLTDYGHPVERHQKTNYCLSWPRTKGTPQYPDEEDKGTF